MGNVVIPVIVGAVCAVVFAVLGFVLGVAHRRKTAEKEIGSATQEATKIINTLWPRQKLLRKKKYWKPRTKCTSSAPTQTGISASVGTKCKDRKNA